MIIRKPFTPLVVSRAIGIPLKNWPGNCYAVATAVVNHGFVKGSAQYGMYYGPISPKVAMYSGRAFARHGWIVGVDHKIYDPTRWVFEGVKPYIYVCDEDSQEYDIGNSRIREMVRSPRPKYDPGDTLFDYGHLSVPAKGAVHDLMYDGDESWPSVLSKMQTFWLANVPFKQFGKEVREIYEWLVNMNLQAWIPYDYQVAVLGPDPCRKSGKKEPKSQHRRHGSRRSGKRTI